MRIKEKRSMLALAIIMAFVVVIFWAGPVRSGDKNSCAALKQAAEKQGCELDYPDAPVEKTGQTTSYQTGDDGDLQQGVGWPNPRFTDNGDGTVTDNLTGLIWLKNANCFNTRTWDQALSDCYELSDESCGLMDGSSVGAWRLPNVKELQSLIDYGFFDPALSDTTGTGKWTDGDPFTNVQTGATTGFYWSSTTPGYDSFSHYYVDVTRGRVSDDYDKSYYVWPVRGGQLGLSQLGPFGWAVGDSDDGYGTIIHTRDGGATWVRQGDSTIIPDVVLNDVSAVDHRNAWAVGGIAGSYGTILRTTDGGETWVRQGDSSSIPDSALTGVSAVDSEVAWAVGVPGVILKTKDGGATWVEQTPDFLPTTTNFQSVSAHDRNNVWAVGSIGSTTAFIVHTTDGGKTWVREGEDDIPQDPHRYYVLIDVHAYDKNTAWAVGGQGTVFITTNGGKRWLNKSWTDERACSATQNVDYNGVCVVNHHMAWKSIDPDEVCLTTNVGNSWKQQEILWSYGSGTVFYGVTAMDENTAWIVGGDYNGNALIFHTTDGGKTPWHEQESPLEVALSRISFAGALR